MKIWNKKNDRRARAEIEKLYVENRSKLLIFVKAAVCNEALADDIVQDVFVEALRKHDEFREHPNPCGWLYQAARYKIKEYLRKLKDWEIYESVEECREMGETEGGYLAAEFSLAVTEVLTREEIMLFRRYFLWGYTVEELAKREGVTINNMRVRITRLKKKLMREIKHLEE